MNQTSGPAGWRWWAPAAICGLALVAGGCLSARVTDAAPAQADGFVVVRVDVAAAGTPISPYIYGTVDGDAPAMKIGGFRLRRRGGNAATRYNWELGNASNSARDWHFANRPQDGAEAHPGDSAPGGFVDRIVREAKEAGAASLVTIPTIGWVARDRDTNTRSSGVPDAGGPPDLRFGPDGIAGYNPLSNQRRTSIRSAAKKGLPFEDPPKRNDDIVFQDEWVHHLVRTHGPAARGGVLFYSMDNEPDLWDETHTDIHPIEPDYEELAERFLEYASAVKDVDPTAKITGPVSWGWTGLFYSPRDRGKDNYGTAAERQEHGGAPFLRWFLRTVRAHDERVGRRTLDVLDVHFYPQGKGLTGDKADADTRARRLRSVRGLWDPDYADESWIRQSVRLIPMLREWIQAEYPGTRLGITEWSFGAEDDITGALATADALGVFGREGLEMAAHWRGSRPGLRTFDAFRLYGNYDGHGSRFGETALPVSGGPHPDLGSIYASRTAEGDLTLVLINKSADAPLPLTIDLGAWSSPQVVHAYTLSERVRNLAQTTEPRVVAGNLQTRLSPYSATIVRLREGAR